jgi:hypothetical protein
MSEWEFKEQRVIDPNALQAVSLLIEDEKGNDITGSVIDNPDFYFILVAYDLHSTNKEAFHRILPFYKKAAGDGYSFICLTSSEAAVIKKFRIENGTAFDYYNSDDAVLKTMVRANPGLILMRSGKVLGKWHYNDFPSYDEVKTKFLKP